VLTATIASEGKKHGTDMIASTAHRDLIDAVAGRVIQQLREMPITGTAHPATTATMATISVSRPPSI
jgi:hypothetical protein